MLVSFNNISFTPYKNIKQQKTVYNNIISSNSACDVVSFGNIDLLSLPEQEVVKRIKKSLSNPENLIGRGGEASVFKIEGSDYCIRFLTALENRNFEHLNFNLSEADKINHYIAKFEDGSAIMPIIKGYTYCSENISNSEVAKIVENIPQESYDSLLKQICDAYEQGLEFDSGWKNIIINPENKSVTAIDFYTPDNYRDKIVNDIYHALVSHSANTQEQRKKCAGKILLSALKLLEPEKKFTPSISAMRPYLLVYELRTHKMFENPKYYKVLANKLLDLEALKQQELLGSNPSLTAQINGQIKVIKVLIRQLFGVV